MVETAAAAAVALAAMLAAVLAAALEVAFMLMAAAAANVMGIEGWSRW